MMDRAMKIAIDLGLTYHVDPFQFMQRSTIELETLHAMTMDHLKETQGDG